MLVRVQQLKIFAVYSYADHALQSSHPHVTPRGYRRTRSQLDTQPDHGRAVTSARVDDPRCIWHEQAEAGSVLRDQDLGQSSVTALLGQRACSQRKYTAKRPETPKLGRQLVIGTGIL